MQEIKKEHYEIMNCYNNSNMEQIEIFLNKYMLFEKIFLYTPDGDLNYIKIIVYDKKENNFKKYFLNVLQYEDYYLNYEELCFSLNINIEDFEIKILTSKEMAKEIELRKNSIENNQYDDFVELYEELLAYEDINLLKKLEKETKLVEHYYNFAVKNKNSYYIFRIDKETMEKLEKIKKIICV